MFCKVQTTHSITTECRIHETETVKMKLEMFEFQKLTDSHQDVRCSCLQLLSQLCPREPLRLSGGRYVDFPDLFCEFSIDQDPRVRASALQSLVCIQLLLFLSPGGGG